MPSISDATRVQLTRTAIVKSAVYTAVTARVDCDLCGPLKGNEATATGGLDHARLRPGHVVKVSTLQIATYGRPSEGERLDVGTPRGRITPDARRPIREVTGKAET
ncbi:MAG: hypothetical protein V4515_14530 [Chloroflexota bacterium]